MCLHNQTWRLLCRNACILVLSNGFSVGCIISVLLHLLLPFDAVDNIDADSASAVSTHVNPTSESEMTHQKVRCCLPMHFFTKARLSGCRIQLND